MWIHQAQPIIYAGARVCPSISQWLMTGSCMYFIFIWCKSDTIAIVHHRLHPIRHRKGEVLQKRGEEEEKLHPGQVLTKTLPLA